MQINFSLPHMFSPSTSNVERDRVQSILTKAVARLEQVYRASHPTSVSPPSGVVNRSHKLFTFDLPSFFNSHSTQTDDDRALRILMDALTDINTTFIEFRPNTPKLYDSGVFYARTQVWDPIPALYYRGYGDCKSLTAAMVAQQRMAGIPCRPVFRWVDKARLQSPVAKGNTNYHILVQTAEGFEDPSKVLGMGAHALY